MAELDAKNKIGNDVVRELLKRETLFISRKS